MATIEKLLRESGPVYKAKVRRRGHPTVTKSFKTRTDAERWARKLETGIDRDDAGLTTPGQKHTLTEAIRQYRKEKLPELRPNTARPYATHLDHWEQRLGHLRLSEVSAVKVAEARDELTAAGKAPATVNRYLATLASVLTACVKRWHWLHESPMRAVAKPVVRNAKTRFLSEDELSRLLQACKESESPDLYLAVLLSITTGARQMEILGLRWTDVDLDAAVMTVRTDAETVTKGGARSLPIVPEALKLLEARRTARGAGNVRALRDSALVFPSRVSRSRPVALRTPWETALKRAGIENFRWHDQRHSAASFLAKSGASLLEIGAVLGHKSANTTKRYSHLTEQHTHNLVRGMADRILNGGGHE
jgi:integrase